MFLVNAYNMLSTGLQKDFTDELGVACENDYELESAVSFQDNVFKLIAADELRVTSMIFKQ